jgi:predicted nucleic acid-binding protein
MRSTAILDTGPLLASINRRDPGHAASSAVLRRRDLDFVIPALVVAEVSWFAERRLGPRGEAAFVRSLRDLDVEAPHPDDWPRIADLVERYGDFPLGTVDASIAVLADRLDTDLIVTLDRRHFGAIRSPQGRSFRILPEPRQVHEDPAGYAAVDRTIQELPTEDLDQPRHESRPSASNANSSLGGSV